MLVLLLVLENIIVHQEEEEDLVLLPEREKVESRAPSEKRESAVVRFALLLCDPVHSPPLRLPARTHTHGKEVIIRSVKVGSQGWFRSGRVGN